MDGDVVVVVGAEDVDSARRSHGAAAFLVRHGAVVTVEWHEASAAAGRVGGGGGGGGGKHGRWTSHQTITGAPQQPAVLRRRRRCGGGPSRHSKALTKAVPPLQWRVACPRRPRNRSESTRRSRNSCGVTKGTPGESSSSCCSVSTSVRVRCLELVLLRCPSAQSLADYRKMRYFNKRNSR